MPTTIDPSSASHSSPKPVRRQAAAVLQQVLREHCVSAVDVVRSIAAFAPAPDHFGVQEPSGLRANIEFHLWLGMVRRAWREAEAGAQLDALLTNAQNEAPAWWAWDGRTGMPKVSEEARNDGHRILESLSTYRDRLLKAPLEDASPLHWMRVAPRRDEHHGDAGRLEQIGFVREHICEFLDKLGVPHSLASPSLPAGPEAGVFGDEPCSNPAPHNAGSALSELPHWVAESDAKVGRSTDPIAQRIRVAIRVARLTRDDLRDVPTTDAILARESWEVLKGWAIDCDQAGVSPDHRHPHYPIVGYDQINEKVVFDPALQFPTMCFRAFEKRLDPGKRGPQKKKKSSELASREVPEES